MDAPDIQIGFMGKLLIVIIIAFGGMAVIYFKRFISWLSGLEE
jgi:hypothetical protein